MTDSLGALSLPVAAPIVFPPTERTLAAGDAALVQLGSFAATVLQADCGAAWAALSPGKPDLIDAVDGARDGTTAARRVFFSDPRKGYFAPEDLPALFVYRTGKASHYLWGADIYRRKWQVAIAWIAPQTDKDPEIRERDAFVNAVSAVLYRAFIDCRHPAWVIPEDATDDDGLLVSPVATALAPVTIIIFDGALAAGIKPGRPVQIKTSAAAAAYNTTDPIQVTGTLDSGVAFTDKLYLTQTNGGETIVGVWSFRQPTQIVIPTQLLTTGAFTFGFYQSPDVKLGSLVQRAAGLDILWPDTSSTAPIVVKNPDGTQRPYAGFELLLNVEESVEFDLAEHGEPYDPDVAPGLTAYINQGNNNPFNSFEL